MTKYKSEIESVMKMYYDNLSEKDKRHYAAVEALKLGHGGYQYIADLFGCCRQTISTGVEELKNNCLIGPERVRQEGGGRKLTEESVKNIDELFLSVISEHIAGDPMDDNIKWVKLTRRDMCLAMEKLGIKTSRTIIKKLLKKHGFKKRKIQRKTATGEYEFRDKQFIKIKKLKKKFQKSKNPIISIDTKKKEKIGNLHRSGSVYCTQAQESYDHDYAHLAEGQLVPHGIYDLKRNEAMINLGVSHETSDFVCDSVKKWWNKHGSRHYPKANEILIFLDSGGANCYRHHVFKYSLQKLVNSIGFPIRICHYPPYSSKWNPIEHRVFPHVTRAMEGVKIDSIDTAKKLIEKTKTTTGLKVFVDVIKKTYQKGLKIVKEVLEAINIKRDAVLGELNYVVSPEIVKC